MARETWDPRGRARRIRRHLRRPKPRCVKLTVRGFCFQSGSLISFSMFTSFSKELHLLAQKLLHPIPHNGATRRTLRQAQPGSLTSYLIKSIPHQIDSDPTSLNSFGASLRHGVYQVRFSTVPNSIPCKEQPGDRGTKHRRHHGTKQK